MNEYDSNRIYDLAKKIDYNKVESIEDADCYVLNKCHIREKATEKVYHDIGRVKKKFRNKKKPIVIITGCVAQAEGEILLKKENYIDAVIGPQSYHQFNNTILKLEKDLKKINSTDFAVIKKFDNLNTIRNSNSNVSSFLTIQEGCDKFCKFCVVPYTRGPEFSRSPREILNEIENLAENGTREIILLGQNVNAYEHNKTKLTNLINEIKKIKNIKRIRYTTSHPVDFTNELIELHKDSDKLMPFVHLPVQSGSNKILKNMNRKHTVEEYIELVEKLKLVNPLIKFSSDFIIGYPGETDSDFEKTLDLLTKIKFINCYSFKYSPRPGTPAAKFKEIDKVVAKERLLFFQKTADKIKLEHKKSLFNLNSTVLFENKMKNGHNQYFGRDIYSNSIIVNSDENLKGKVKEVKIIKGNKNTLYGQILEKINKADFAA